MADKTLDTLGREIRDYLPRLWDRVGSQNFSITNKSGFKDIVTSTDIEIEDRLRTFLGELLPEAAYLGEESGPTERSSLMWIVDPVDGTTNFSKANPHYSTQVALYEGGAVVLGITYDRNRGEMFQAVHGRGAYLNGERIRVSETEGLEEASGHVGLQYSSRKGVFDRMSGRLNRAIQLCRAVRITGSACLDLAYVACGRADVFWEEILKPWDVASGVLLVREAGGLINSCNEEPFDLFEPAILATNGSKRLLEKFRSGVLFSDQPKNFL